MLVNHRLPAIAFGGPPHSGKSVLTYLLSQRLRQSGIEHYLLRATPDGEGNWSYESSPQLVEDLRHKGEFSTPFMEGTIDSVKHRELPLLVDLGGKPLDWQIELLQHCTHAVLLISKKKDTVDIREDWKLLFTKARVPLIAQLTSALAGTQSVSAETPLLIAHLTQLEREASLRTPDGVALDAVYNQLSNIFTSSKSAIAIHQTASPAHFVFLPAFARDFGALNNRWTPSMLLELSQRVPAQTPIAVYGAAPNWVYGLLAAHADTTVLWQFDPRLGWIVPPMIHWKTKNSPKAPWTEVQDLNAAYTIVKLNEIHGHLVIDQHELFNLSPPPDDRGVILSGKLPLWLFTALVRHFKPNYPWVACYQPMINGAVVVCSKVQTHPIGTVVRV